MKTSEATAELFKGLATFRKQLKQPLKDADNPFFKSKYVPLENVVSVIDDALPETGLSYVQEVSYNDIGSIGIETIITHESGQYMIIEGAMVKPTKNDPQGVGSAMTYARRYSLSAAFGIASDTDDDGNQASAGKPTTQTKPRQQGKPKAQPAIAETPEVQVQKNIEWVNTHYKPEIELIKSWQAMAPADAMKAIKEYVAIMKLAEVEKGAVK